MELKINNFNNSNEIEFNYDTLKNELKLKLEQYKGRVYTENTISVAKNDRAELNKIAKAFDEKRLEIKKMYMKPFNDFEDKVKELVNITKETSNVIDKQIKEFEETRKQEKLEIINGIISDLNINNYRYDLLFDDKFLNKTCSENEIIKEITQSIEKIDEDLEFLKSQEITNNFEVAKECYFKNNGNITITIKELQEINKIVQKETNIKVVNKDIKEEIKEFNLTIFATDSQFKAIKDFLKSNGIESL